MMKSSIVEKVATPFKLGRAVLEGSGIEGAFDSHGVDVPFVFRHNDRFYMTYIGFDGIGYQTALAVSDNLLDWEHLDVILKREETTHWDHVGAAGTWILKQTDGLYDLPTLRKYNNRYWMMYHSYPSTGYEAGAAEIGLAWCEDEQLLEWHKLERPIFSWKDGAEWERGGLYKSSLVEHEGKFYMFYNAKDVTSGKWSEQTGVAISEDLLHWERVPYNPVIPVSVGRWDGKFVSDPAIYKDGELWLIFYFGYNGIHAQEGLAVSRDLITWEKHDEPIIPYGPQGSLDATHAHKASVVYHIGILYHFYCAVRPSQEGDTTSHLSNEYRTITVATSATVCAS